MGGQYALPLFVYLFLEFGPPCWAYSCYGRKIEEAMELRKSGAHVQIVNETDFWDAVWDNGLE